MPEYLATISQQWVTHASVDLTMEAESANAVRDLLRACPNIWEAATRYAPTLDDVRETTSDGRLEIESIDVVVEESQIVLFPS
jgi:hypothetical protein